MSNEITLRTNPAIITNELDSEIIVIGTGMGAGAAGYHLAKAGYDVLFLEKGLSSQDWDPQLAGHYTEVFFGGKSNNEKDNLLQKSARGTFKLNGNIPVIGSGQGGSSAIYGAGLLRFIPSDFESWPFSYQDLLDYYNLCDRLFVPMGTQDPLGDHRTLAPPPELSDSGKETFSYLTDKQLHPYRPPIAYKNVDSCQECVGFFCQNNCKQTAGNVFITPSVENYGAKVRYQTKVQTLLMENGRCVGVHCNTPAGPIQLKARYIFIGAGALITPTILMNSKSDNFPQGIGNNNDLVGRYLMRHLIDFFYIKTKSKDLVGRAITELSLSDYYCDKKNRWGIINIVGGLMSPQLVAQVFAEQHFHTFPLIGKLIKPFIKAGFSFLTAGRILATTIMEDEASFENRVLPNSTIDDVKIKYHISLRDKQRLRAFRKELKGKLKDLSPNLIKVADENMMISHACGTCRMGNNPKTSVVDPHGRIHATENIYIVDASIFPTSGAANPSLTVAACGLKIADEFHKKLSSENASV
ncbi:GMC oxidoreductase [Methylomonas sp. MgM2]